MAVADSVLRLHPDRLLPPEPASGPSPDGCATMPCATPVISPHGHVDPQLPVDDGPLRDPARLFVTPGHYVTRLGTPIVAALISVDGHSDLRIRRCPRRGERIR
jgi:glucuronate isomerase